MGRTAAGVRGMGLAGDEVVGMEILSPGATDPDRDREGLRQAHAARGLPVQKRGGQGVITIRTSDRNGEVVSASRRSSTTTRSC